MAVTSKIYIATLLVLGRSPVQCGADKLVNIFQNIDPCKNKQRCVMNRFPPTTQNTPNKSAYEAAVHLANKVIFRSINDKDISKSKCSDLKNSNAIKIVWAWAINVGVQNFGRDQPRLWRLLNVHSSIFNHINSNAKRTFVHWGKGYRRSRRWC